MVGISMSPGSNSLFLGFIIGFTFDVDSGQDVLEGRGVQQITDFLLRLMRQTHQRSTHTYTYIYIKTWNLELCRGPYQTLLAEQAEQEGVAHLPQVLEAHSLQLGVLHDVLQLVVEELQDAWWETQAECLKVCSHTLRPAAVAEPGADLLWM